MLRILPAWTEMYSPHSTESRGTAGPFKDGDVLFCATCRRSLRPSVSDWAHLARARCLTSDTAQNPAPDSSAVRRSSALVTIIHTVPYTPHRLHTLPKPKTHFRLLSSVAFSPLEWKIFLLHKRVSACDRDRDARFSGEASLLPPERDPGTSFFPARHFETDMV